MKHFLIPILHVCIICNIMLFLGCSDDKIEENKEFSVSPIIGDTEKIGLTITVNAGEPITFNFKGHPDLVVFYSGEKGHEYSKKDVGVSSSMLNFNATPQYGIIPGTLNVYLSTTFEGLSGDNKKNDSIAIVTAEWIDITEQCDLPTKSGENRDVSIILDEYIGENLTIAFNYLTTQNTQTQPKWTIAGLHVQNTLLDGNIEILKAKDLGFKPIDMLAEKNPYKDDGGQGTWDLRNIANDTNPFFVMPSSPVGAPLNNDWLISGPIELSGPATGIELKNLSSYEYSYLNPGVYVATFVAKYSNDISDKEVIRQFVVKVIETNSQT